MTALTTEKALMNWMDEHGCRLYGATPSMLVAVVRSALAVEVRAPVDPAVAYKDWAEAELNAAMMPVVRAVGALKREYDNFLNREDAYEPETDAITALFEAWETFRAAGFLPDIELENSDHG